ncbi:MAG: bifunctional (p)ppGpp synthetase/guanosine-3',5'-bis(diphosphate) 3'-pyrophosphohydrolase [SAR202 cluster bacterium]|nr:bifunctional (p)ppGpp synthetase/guanosine-3',5'-bis(diphosphate) 3'-pyrophosphohydrolase [SAR202 cluster bacterium]MQG71670.1 bifunctional (p)ppGpp synthetase/guanosine-3',5'-bis(diphosphate) 3'-pyrophosphohydrolase [SAR202 cluster bacterium]
MRQSGDPYIAHPLETALFLADLHLDTHTIVAALLHDVVEDCGVSLEEITLRFGPEVSKLVDGVTKLTRMDDKLQPPAEDVAGLMDDAESLHAESLRKMLVSMAEDIRVVLIKLADRLHNMNTLDALPPEKRKRIAQETLDIYSPLAHRLGIWEIKWRLDDLAFRHLNEEKYREISKILASKRTEREDYIEKVSSTLRDELAKYDITAEVIGRPKGIYSTYLKMEKYQEQGKQLGDIYDLFALRVLVNETADCYKTLGVVHQLWHPIPGQFDDYIGNPKENMYQALHTTVICDGGTPLEVQIKTFELHQIAEYGVAAHWAYKEGNSGDQRFEEKMTWLRQLIDWQREVSGTAEFIESVKQDIFHDQVFVYTPKGRIVELTSGSTPVDFAYKIHTALGHHCIGAKVNGKLVALDTTLENGDTVEVINSKSDRGPSLDWLNPNRGFVRSAGARQSVRQWFRKQERSTNIEHGKEVLRRELRRLNQKINDETILGLFKVDTMDDLMADLGSGNIAESLLSHRLAQIGHETEEPLAKRRNDLPLTSLNSGITVLGVGDLLVHIGRCCNPIPGDPIIGFITRIRGVTVHKQDCPSVRHEDEPERLVNVQWGKEQQLYPVRIIMKAYDRVGLLRDVTALVSNEGVNIASVVTGDYSNGTVTLSLTCHTTGLDQLNKLFSKLDGVRGCISVTRDHTIMPLSSRS